MEVVVVVAIEETFVRGGAERDEWSRPVRCVHGSVDCSVVVVTEQIRFVDAVIDSTRVRSARLHGAESMRELVRLDRTLGEAPTATVHPGSHGNETVVIVVPSLAFVRHDFGHPAHHVGVHPHQVLAVGPAVALGRKVACGASERRHAFGRQRDLGDVHVALGVGNEADMADAARLRCAVVENAVYDPGPIADERRYSRIVVGIA
jgi:hypothetical protein